MFILFLEYSMHHLNGLVICLRFLLKHKLFKIYQFTSQSKYSELLFETILLHDR